ncbi:microcephalin isoform X1 [Anguilla rostrata]|uniref:microcephalin isoform X1 n=1 Tax=Anguilla rostrata TaxID=7938 RepID=UPI0030CC26CE
MTSEKLSDTLKDVVAFVDVWSSSRTENYSKPFIQQLQEMGAEVSKTFDKHVTHVVFKNGHQHTWNKAKKRGVKLVSVLWVARCNDCGEHIDEELCPAVNEGTHRNPTLNKRTHRCMQPRDIPEKTPENNKLMKRKLDRMMKSLEVSSFSSPDAPDASPFLIDKASGVIYSPSSQRASDMAQRLKVMKERRESLSRLDSCDEDDSSDLDTSFSDFHSSSTGSKSEATKGEVQHPHKTPTFDLGTTGSDIEMNRSATELPRTDTKKQAFVCHRAKKETAERPCPQGPRSERKPPERQKLSNSSIQSGALECQTSLESPCPGVLLAEGVNTQSPVGLDGWVIRKQRESSFKCDQAEKARSQSPGVTEPFGGSESTPSVESKRVLNTEGTDPCGQTKASKVYSLFRAVGRSVKKTLVMTSMSIDRQDTVLQVVSSLGGFSLAEAVGVGTTHVVTGRPRRTLSVLLGIARGCWILSFEWILCCLEEGRWVSEEPYELSDHFPAASICRLQQHLSAGEHQQDLFSDQPVMFVSPQSQPPTRSLVELIQLCGGTVCKTVRQAGICIGFHKGKKPQGTRSLSEQWVLDCLTHLKELPYDNYDLDRKSE